jgi:hypothetical protein
MALGFRIGRHAASEPMLIGHLVAVAIDAITLRGMENILYAAGSQPGVAQAVRVAVEDGWRKPSMAYAMQAEAVMQYVVIDRLRKGGKKAEQELYGSLGGAPPGGRIVPESAAERNRVLDENGLALLSMTRRITEAADKPYPEAVSTIQQVSNTIQQSRESKYTLARILSPVFEQAAAKRAQDEAIASTVRCAAALLVWKRKNGRFPEQLGDVVDPVPTDPFDLKPLRYRREGNGFVVWSVGEKLTFDGGDGKTKPTGHDVLFRYPLPAYLRETTPSK